MPSDAAEIVIYGKTVEGEVFQPPDWAERLCESLALKRADGRKTFSSYVRPMMIEGVNSMVVRAALRKDDTEAFEQARQYIVANRLMVRAGRGGAYVTTTGAFPALGHDRRDPNRNNW
jgi:hypothetical protein